jgi:hypothetical protein
MFVVICQDKEIKMSKNDTKIKEILKAIEDKKKNLGEKPKWDFNTNLILTLDSTNYNINTLSIKQCVVVLIKLETMNFHISKMCERLNIDLVSPLESAYSVREFVEDLELRVKILKYSEQVKELEVLERQVLALRSEDAKVADELSSILGKLK